MGKLKLPIGIQTFSEIRTGGYAYVDKSAFIAKLAESGKYYFLSRPRRFGKSLFLDTLDCAFSGRRELFQGLYLDDPTSGWDWGKRYPVVRISFGSGTLRSPEDLKDYMRQRLWEESEKLGISLNQKLRPSEVLLHLVQAAFKRHGERVVVLVDEYDKPILDNLETPEIAVAMREELKSLYSVLKDCDPYLRFVFLTGVSKSAKTGIFSGLNNLEDITIDATFSAICGYTQNDLESIFGDWLTGLDREDVRSWYNGYSWTGEAVYNPFDILLLLKKRTFSSWWFETGTPTFLIDLLCRKPRSLPDLDRLVAGEELLGSFRIEDLAPEAFMFQAGYLTIREWSSDAKRGTRYLLGFPNREVRQAFNSLMLGTLTMGKAEDSGWMDRLFQVLDAGDTEGLRVLIHSFFASIPHDWYRKNRLSGFEGYYASVIYAYFASVGLDVIPEDTTNKGRIDLTVKTPTGIWILEFKVKGLDRSGDKSPLLQIRDRGYAEKFRADSRPIRQIGIIFDPETRNLDGWEIG